MLDRYNRYTNSTLYRLEDCYNNASCNKYQAMEYCKNLMNKYNGHNLKIIGYNCMQFSVGFEFVENGSLCFAFITKDYDRYCVID